MSQTPDRCLLSRLPLLSRVHRDERGAVSLETILIVAAIALPILIFILSNQRGQVHLTPLLDLSCLLPPLSAPLS